MYIEPRPGKKKGLEEDEEENYSYITTNKMHLLSQIIYSCKTLYMFRRVFPPIIRSSKPRIQQRYMSNNCCYLLLFDIYCCCIRSFELLMMDGKTVRNM